MDPASAEFGAILADTVLQKPALPAYANRTAEPYGENVRELLTQQINHPVRLEGDAAPSERAGL